MFYAPFGFWNLFIVGGGLGSPKALATAATWLSVFGAATANVMATLVPVPVGCFTSTVLQNTIVLFV